MASRVSMSVLAESTRPTRAVATVPVKKALVALVAATALRITTEDWTDFARTAVRATSGRTVNLAEIETKTAFFAMAMVCVTAAPKEVGTARATWDLGVSSAISCALCSIWATAQ